MASYSNRPTVPIAPAPNPGKRIDNPTSTVPGQPSIVKKTPQTPTSSPGPVAGVAPSASGGASPTKTPSAGPSKGAGGSTYGYSTTDKTPFNPYQSYPTVGALNAAAIAAAAPGYQPQLNQAAADKAAEIAATKQRMQQLTGIYSSYGSQAQQAFNQTQQALNGIIAANATGDSQSQGVLQAALASATGGQNDLGAMMGISGTPTAQEVAPYMSAAAGENAGTGSELKSLAGGLMSTVGAGVSNAALEGAQQKDIESTRHLAALQSNQQSRDAIIAQIPNLINAAKQQLISNALNASGLQFQQKLAQQQLALAQKTEAANASNAAGTLALNKTNSAANIANAKAQLAQNQQVINNNYQIAQQTLAATNAKTAAALQTTIAKAQGAQEANALKYLTTWAAPTPLEISKTTKTLPDGTVVHAGSIDPTKYHRDVGAALKTLMTNYGLSLQTALSYLETLTIPIGGNQTMTVAQWAQTFIQRSQAQATKTAGQPLVPGTIYNDPFFVQLRKLMGVNPSTNIFAGYNGIPLLKSTPAPGTAGQP